MRGDAELHFFDGGPLTAQYLLVLDALNFCFWPEPGLEYEHLASGLKVRRSLHVLRDRKRLGIDSQAFGLGSLEGPRLAGRDPASISIRMVL